MKDNIQNVHVFWEQYAQSDPLWAILSDPAMKNRQWDLQHFFQTGRHEMSLLFFHLNQLDIQIDKRKSTGFRLWGRPGDPGLGRLFRVRRWRRHFRNHDPAGRQIQSASRAKSAMSITRWMTSRFFRITNSTFCIPTSSSSICSQSSFFTIWQNCYGS